MVTLMINYFNGVNLLLHLCALAWASTFPTNVTLNDFGFVQSYLLIMTYFEAISLHLGI